MLIQISWFLLKPTNLDHLFSTEDISTIYSHNAQPLVKSVYEMFFFEHPKPGHVAQSVTWLATDAKLTADPGVANSIPAWSHTFVEIDFYGHSPPFH